MTIMSPDFSTKNESHRKAEKYRLVSKETLVKVEENITDSNV
jgi:hypothetical protein